MGWDLEGGGHCPVFLPEHGLVDGCRGQGSVAIQTLKYWDGISDGDYGGGGDGDDDDLVMMTISQMRN